MTSWLSGSIYYTWVALLVIIIPIQGIRNRIKHSQVWDRKYRGHIYIWSSQECWPGTGSGRSMWGVWLFLLALLYPGMGRQRGKNSGGGRHGRLFNMFSVVNFPNDECTGSSTKGVCVAGSECAARGGIILGSCASGFGSCCAIYKTDCTSSDFQFNLTYITNPGYPSFYTTAGTCKYTLTKTSSDICRIRLDFVDAQLASPDTKGACTTDYFTGTQVTGPTIPPICGANAGHHIYLDAGGSSSSSATFSAVLTGTTTNRQWRILVSQIECSSRSLAPQGCLQYLTGWYGTVKSFNYDTSSTYEHLTSQGQPSKVKHEISKKSYMTKSYLETSP